MQKQEIINKKIFNTTVELMDNRALDRSEVSYFSVVALTIAAVVMIS